MYKILGSSTCLEARENRGIPTNQQTKSSLSVVPKKLSCPSFIPPLLRLLLDLVVAAAPSRHHQPLQPAAHRRLPSLPSLARSLLTPASMPEQVG